MSNSLLSKICAKEPQRKRNSIDMKSVFRIINLTKQQDRKEQITDMTRTLSWRIGAADSSATIEQFLRAHGCSHHVMTHLKRTERGILRNGVWAYTNERLSAGDLLEICLIESESSVNITPIRMSLSIVYEDEDLLVINKPADTPIHPSINNHENTLANGIMYYYASQNIPFVYRCINRLDRDTSGLLIIAKNMVSAAILSKMSAGRRIRREYLAIAEGTLDDSGTIDAPIARACGSAIERCVDFVHGERAVTHYKSLLHFFAEVPKQAESISSAELPLHTESFSDPKIPAQEENRPLTLVSVRLETGRTHQIRVHMKHIGHPLIGDFLYHPSSAVLMQRQALHSYRLSFCHPLTGKELDFTCEPPEDMKRLLPKDI